MDIRAVSHGHLQSIYGQGFVCSMLYIVAVVAKYYIPSGKQLPTIYFDDCPMKNGRVQVFHATVYQMVTMKNKSNFKICSIKLDGTVLFFKHQS